MVRTTAALEFSSRASLPYLGTCPVKRGRCLEDAVLWWNQKFPDKSTYGVSEWKDSRDRDLLI